MIDVIIPAYNAHETIETTLYSIAYQDMVDSLNVYIVNDNSDKDYKELVEYFSNFCNIKELKLKENSGPGIARQFGIDNSNGDYIVFIDADDTFSDCLALTNLYNSIKDGCDVVVSTFLEETDNNFVEKQNNTIWLHGKMYSRSFLTKHNIRFNNTRHNEDNGFNRLVLLCGADIKYINYVTYIWRNNKNSITRKNNWEYEFTGINGYIINMGWALDEANKRNIKKKYLSVLAYSSLLAIYYYYLDFINKDKVNDFIKLSKPIKKYYNPSLLNEDEILEIVKTQFHYSVDDHNIIKSLDPVITFTEFLNRIEGEEL